MALKIEFMYKNTKILIKQFMITTNRMEVFEVFLSDKVLTVIGLHNVYRSCDDGLSGAQYLTFVEYTLLKQLLPQHENIYFALEIFHRSFRILTLALAESCGPSKWRLYLTSKHLKSHFVPHVSDVFAEGSFRAHRE